MLKSGGEGLRDVCVTAFELICPGLGNFAAPALDSLPSPTQVRYHTFTLDLAYLLLEQELDDRENQEEDAYVRFGSHDSSPLWGYDWLWSQTYSIKGGSSLLSFFAGAHRMIRGFRDLQSQHREEEDAADFWQDVQQLPEELLGLMRELYPQVRVHTQVPSVIASGYQGLVHKIAATVQGAAMERPDFAKLQRHHDTFMALTTDMGTEFGMAEFQCSSIRQLLPPWQGWQKFAADMAEDDCSDQADESQSPRFDIDMADEAGDDAAQMVDDVAVDEPEAAPPEPASQAPESNYIYRKA